VAGKGATVEFGLGNRPECDAYSDHGKNQRSRQNEEDPSADNSLACIYRGLFGACAWPDKRLRFNSHGFSLEDQMAQPE
jgi:hypothetical protein